MEETNTRTQALVSRFSAGMAARGYDPAYVAALTERHAALFRLLAGADLDALFRPRPSHGRWRAMLPAAFAGADPETAAEILSVLYAARTVMYGPRLEKTAAAPRTPEAPARSSLRLPTAAEFRARAEALKNDPAELRREAERKVLFGSNAPQTAGTAAARIRFLQREYGVRLPNADLAAEKIPALGIDVLARAGRTAAVELLADMRLNGGHRKNYLFAVAYCHCLQPRRYPVFDRHVEKALCALREEAGFYPFLNSDLRDYERYLKVLSIFSEACGLTGTPLYRIAAYLRDLGLRLDGQD